MSNFAATQSAAHWQVSCACQWQLNWNSESPLLVDHRLSVSDVSSVCLSPSQPLLILSKKKKKNLCWCTVSESWRSCRVSFWVCLGLTNLCCWNLNLPWLGLHTTWRWQRKRISGSIMLEMRWPKPDCRRCNAMQPAVSQVRQGGTVLHATHVHQTEAAGGLTERW